MNKSLKSFLFFGGLVVVVGVFYALSTLDAPPDMPPLQQHTLTFNNNNELIGLADFSLPRTDADGNEIPQTVKGIAQSINIVCTSCHGGVNQDLSAHACQQLTAPCLTDKHPPKSTCIKCHRMASNQPATVPSAAGPAAPAASALAAGTAHGDGGPATPTGDAGDDAPAAEAPAAEAPAAGAGSGW